jgi:hypothetical protein
MKNTRSNTVFQFGKDFPRLANLNGCCRKSLPGTCSSVNIFGLGKAAKLIAYSSACYFLCLRQKKEEWKSSQNNSLQFCLLLFMLAPKEGRVGSG